MSTPLEDALSALPADGDLSPELFRLIVGHQGWLAPLEFLARMGIDRVENIATFGERTRLPAGALWLFTCRAAAERADQAARRAGGHIALGGYGSPVPGWRLFRGIGRAGLRVVTVNPSPDGTGSITFAHAIRLNMPRHDLDALETWAQGVELELALDDVADPMARFVALLRCDHLLGLAWPDGEIARFPITLDGGVSNPLMVFTSPDHAQPWLDKLPAEDRARLKWRTIRATDLFVHGDTLAKDAVALNLFSADKRLVLAAESRDLMHRIASWAEPAAEPR